MIYHGPLWRELLGEALLSVMLGLWLFMVILGSAMVACAAVLVFVNLWNRRGSLRRWWMRRHRRKCMRDIRYWLEAYGHMDTPPGEERRGVPMKLPPNVGPIYVGPPNHEEEAGNG